MTTTDRDKAIAAAREDAKMKALYHPKADAYSSIIIERYEASMRSQGYEWGSTKDGVRWQPIETNKFKSGDHVLVVDALKIPFIAWRYLEDSWVTHGRKVEPTHWMPLPAPPVAEGKD